MKQIFFLSTLQVLSCCEHISNYQILIIIKGDFDNDVLIAIIKQCYIIAYKKPLIANSVTV